MSLCNPEMIEIIKDKNQNKTVIFLKLLKLLLIHYRSKTVASYTLKIYIVLICILDIFTVEKNKSQKNLNSFL